MSEWVQVVPRPCSRRYRQHISSRRKFDIPFYKAMYLSSITEVQKSSINMLGQLCQCDLEINKSSYKSDCLSRWQIIGRRQLESRRQLFTQVCGRSFISVCTEERPAQAMFGHLTESKEKWQTLLRGGFSLGTVYGMICQVILLICLKIRMSLIQRLQFLEFPIPQSWPGMWRSIRYVTLYLNLILALIASLLALPSCA